MIGYLYTTMKQIKRRNIHNRQTCVNKYLHVHESTNTSIMEDQNALNNYYICCIHLYLHKILCQLWTTHVIRLIKSTTFNFHNSETNFDMGNSDLANSVSRKETLRTVSVDRWWRLKSYTGIWIGRHLFSFSRQSRSCSVSNASALSRKAKQELNYFSHLGKQSQEL